MTKDTPLLHCPFCGSAEQPKVEPYPSDQSVVGGFWVVCDASGVEHDGCGASSGWQRTPGEAALAWNDRSFSTLERDLTACRAALRELVACKDLHDRIEARDLSDYSIGDTARTQELDDEYQRRKPLAWSVARAILQSTGEGEGK